MGVIHVLGFVDLYGTIDVCGWLGCGYSACIGTGCEGEGESMERNDEHGLGWAR